MLYLIYKIKEQSSPEEAASNTPAGAEHINNTPQILSGDFTGGSFSHEGDVRFNHGSRVSAGQEHQSWCLLQTHVSRGCPRRSVGSRAENQLHWQAYARRPLLLFSLALSFCWSGALFLLSDS